MLRATAILVSLVSASPLASAAEPFFPFFEPVQPPRRVQIMAHRGLQSVAPENTADAVLACGFEFIEWAEVDVRRTQDGTHVILHDSTLDRTTSGTGPVREITAEDFVALDAGAWYGDRFKGRRPLTLAELLKLARGKVNLSLDCKDVEPALLVEEILAAKTGNEVEALDAGRWFSGRFAGTKVPSLDAGLIAMSDRSAAYLDAKQIAPEALIAAIRNHDLLERSAVYQSREYLAKLRALEPAVRTMPPLGGLGDLDAIAAEQPYAVDARWAALTPELIQRCHSAGIRVFSDALGPFELVEQYREKIGWGIDVIQTDHPLRLLRAIELTESIEAEP